MTKNSPRIYVYKITFDEVPHYYYGLHKEKKFDEYYMGSPKTHKVYWEKYTPRKEYLKFFEFSNVGYNKARKFEDNLIAPVLNDELCLNEHVGGLFSLETFRKAGKIGGKRVFELCIGIHARSKEQMTEDGKKSAQKNKENGTAIFGMTSEELSEAGKKGGEIAYKKGLGFHARSKEQMIEDGKTASSQKWKCTITGYSSTAGGLTIYQNKRGIDTSNRIKVDSPRSWEITFKDDKVIVTIQTLKDWAKENGYSYDGLLDVRAGKIKSHKDIIKIICF